MAGHLGKHPRRLHVEPLEARRMLAVATVNTELDIVDITDGVTSLREAIFAANTLSGADTIEFDASLDGATIDLVQALGELAITDSLTIDASSLAGGLTIDAGNGTDNTFATGDGIRIFNIDDGDDGNEFDVSIVGLTLSGGDSNDRTGGAIRSLENLTISHSTITGNSITEAFFFAEGGGIYNQFGDLSVIESTISNNSAISLDGGLALGGGISARNGDVTITRSTISGNVATSQNRSYGAGISAGIGNLTLIESTVSENRIEGDGAGGGMSLGGGQFSVINSTITGNIAAWGGGIYALNAELTVRKSLIEDNGTGGNGGGLYIVASNTDISHTTFSGNSARLGGAIFQLDPPFTLISNSTISGNTATHGGGGVYTFFGQVEIRHSTITQNTAPAGYGSGVASRGSESTRTDVFSSIIAGNTNEDVAVGNGTFNSFQSLGYNLLGSGNSFDSGAQNALDNFGQTGDQTGVINSLLGPLTDNGGLTSTHALLVGSPAIDAGDPSFVGPPNYDQRGFAYNRVVDGRIDIGAFEYGAVSADFDEDGVVDGFDFLAWQRGFGTPAPLAVKSDGDADDDTDVDGEDLAAWEVAYGANGVAPLVAGFAVVGDDTARHTERAVRSPATAPFSNAQLVDLALAANLSIWDLGFGNSDSSEGQHASEMVREEVFAALDVSPRQDEDAAVVFAGERRLGLVGDVAERYLSDQGLQSLDDVPLGGKFFPDL